MIGPTTVLWRGKLLSELTRGQLLEALIEALRHNERERRALPAGIAPVPREGLKDEADISEAEVTVRIANRLKGRTVGEVRRMSDADLLLTPGLGVTSLAEIRNEIGPYIPPTKEPPSPVGGS